MCLCGKTYFLRYGICALVSAEGVGCVGGCVGHCVWGGLRCEAELLCEGAGGFRHCNVVLYNVVLKGDVGLG